VKTALVTGVVGQDGAYLARLLLRQGYRVLGTTPESVASPPGFEETYLDQVAIRRVDLTDRPGMRALLEADRPDEIYNMASISSVAQSWEAPLYVAQINGLAFLGLLETVRGLRDSLAYDPRICQASSAEIFGTPEFLPQDEKHPVRPANPYAVAKAFAHFSAANYRDAYGMFVSTTILFNHESPLRPPSFVTRKITSAAVEIAAGRREVLELGRLDVRRDWGSADDYVRAMHATLQAEEPDDFCVATGTSHSLMEFVQFAFEAAGVADFEDRVRTNPDYVRPTDITETKGAPDKARLVLGWHPSRTLKDVVAAMVEADQRRMLTGADHDVEYM
jgi:GDPmannose 4,6-dehydratase